MTLQTEGIISERAYNRNEKAFLKRAIAAVLTEIGFSFTLKHPTETSISPSNVKKRSGLYRGRDAYFISLLMQAI